MNQALQFLFRAVADLIVWVVILRFLLQWFRADFRNQLSQAILQITSPIITPVRRVVPALGRIDTATVLVVVLLECVFVFLMFKFNGLSVGALDLVFYAALRSVYLTLQLIWIILLISVILSWLAQGYNPAAAFIHSISEPILRPFRRFIPPISGLDLSPMVALLLIYAVNIVVRQSMPYFL